MYLPLSHIWKVRTGRSLNVLIAGQTSGTGVWVNTFLLGKDLPRDFPHQMDSNEWVYHLHFRRYKVWYWRFKLEGNMKVQWWKIFVFAGREGGCVKASTQGWEVLDCYMRWGSRLKRSHRRDHQRKKRHRINSGEKIWTIIQLCKPCGFILYFF